MDFLGANAPYGDEEEELGESELEELNFEKSNKEDRKPLEIEIKYSIAMETDDKITEVSD